MTTVQMSMWWLDLIKLMLVGLPAWPLCLSACRQADLHQSDVHLCRQQNQSICVHVPVTVVEYDGIGPLPKGGPEPTWPSLNLPLGCLLSQSSWHSFGPDIRHYISPTPLTPEGRHTTLLFGCLCHPPYFSSHAIRRRNPSVSVLMTEFDWTDVYR